MSILNLLSYPTYFNLFELVKCLSNLLQFAPTWSNLLIASQICSNPLTSLLPNCSNLLTTSPACWNLLELVISSSNMLITNRPFVWKHTLLPLAVQFFKEAITFFSLSIAIIDVSAFPFWQLILSSPPPSLVKTIYIIIL